MNKNWTEFYRPKTFDEYVFQGESGRMIEKIKSSKNIPNLMLYGIRGTGKTTMANLIVKMLDIPKTDVLRVNCSDQKIDFIREVVMPFATSMPDGEIRIVRLEEFDYLSKDAQALLRSFIEEVHSNCRFIATCNYPNRVLVELRSRFTEVEFKSPDLDSLVDRVLHILDSESIEYDPDSVMGIISEYYPDIRAILNYLESNSVDGKLSISQKNTNHPWKDVLKSAVAAKNLFGQRKILATLTADDLDQLFTFLSAEFSTLPIDKVRMAIPIIAESLYRLSFVGSPELQLAAMLVV
jgi:DNA polymerase III delta prime subunit